MLKKLDESSNEFDEFAKFEEVLRSIAPLDEVAQGKAKAHLDNLTKPPGSLGKLEEIAVQLAGITGSFPLMEMKKAIMVMAGDHGVCAEGVSAFPQEVTPQMVLNFLSGGAAINVLARHAGADVICVDMGILTDLQDERLYVRKIRRGTGNIAREEAMSRKEAVQAIVAGIGMVEVLYGQNYRLFATGEMGIGNTTPSAAMLSVLAGLDVEQTVGRGTGINDLGVSKKQQVVRQAISLHQPDPNDPLDVLSKLGGLEIAGLVGVILGSAAHRCPVVIDGFIASVAALTASRLSPESVQYMILSHLSQESGHRILLEQLRLEPTLNLQMRLGEGTGAALMMPLIDAAVKIMREMATFESAGVSRE